MREWIKVGVICLLFLPIVVQAKNVLKNHDSPYLAMHGDDPVHWMEWGETALQKARKENKPILVSIGYFACHWCHVMQKESYQHADVAKILNEHFVSIKVDRELNPVLDKRLIAFVQATTGTAGWPLNVFLTPEGYPLIGMVYAPKEHFESVLIRLNDQWKIKSKGLRALAKNMTGKISQAILAAESKGKKKHLADNADAFIRHAMENANILQGGFGEVRQFPSAPELLSLLRLNRSKQDEDIDEFLRLTLDNMQSKGLHDEIAGGFYRYTVDPAWSTPHFEKMLYTNALLAIVYQQAYEQYGDPRYLNTALETVRFLLQDMREGDSFIASLSAIDDKHVEGGYYLWRQADLKRFLSEEEQQLANLAWGLKRNTELEGGNLPILQMSMDRLASKWSELVSRKVTREEFDQSLAKLKVKFKQYRLQQRVLPKDDKRLAGWNGLVLAALSSVLQYDRSLMDDGNKLATFLISHWDGNRLKQSLANNQAGNLHDYAALAWGLLKWARATDQVNLQKVASQIITQAWSVFYTSQGWKESESSLLPSLLYRQHIEDDPIPSSESLLVEASLLLKASEAHSNYPWDKQLKRLLKHSTESVENSPFEYGYLISVAKQAVSPAAK